jgi:hypothetical protein
MNCAVLVFNHCLLNLKSVYGLMQIKTATNFEKINSFQYITTFKTFLNQGNIFLPIICKVCQKPQIKSLTTLTN